MSDPRPVHGDGLLLF